MRRRDDNRQTFLSNSEDHYSKYSIRKCAIDVYDGRASVFCRDARIHTTQAHRAIRMTISRLIRLEPGEWRRQFSINNAHRYRKDGECCARIVPFGWNFHPTQLLLGLLLLLLCFVFVATIHAIWGRCGEHIMLRRICKQIIIIFGFASSQTSPTTFTNLGNYYVYYFINFGPATVCRCGMARHEHDQI